MDSLKNSSLAVRCLSPPPPPPPPPFCLDCDASALLPLNWLCVGSQGVDMACGRVALTLCSPTQHTHTLHPLCLTHTLPPSL